MECWSTGVVGSKSGHEVHLFKRSGATLCQKIILFIPLDPSLQYSNTPILQLASGSLSFQL